MSSQWDPDAGAYRCYYTGVKLLEEGRSPRSVTWEHRVPGDESSVVLVAELVNKMKAYMTEKEFRRMVRELSRRFDGQPFSVSAFPSSRR
jgi:hypothetical protein